MSAPDRLAFGGFVLDRAQQRVLHDDGRPVLLTPRLFSALLLFVEHAGELLDKESMMAALWPGLVVEENNLNQVVHALRRALGDDGSRFIETVPRRGFRFVAAISAVPASEGASAPEQPVARAAPVASAALADALPTTVTPLPARSAIVPADPVIRDARGPDPPPSFGAAAMQPAGRRARGWHWPVAALVFLAAVGTLLALTLDRRGEPSIDAEVADRRSIAVMPFTDLSEPKAPHVAYAVDQELTDDLGRLDNMRVVPRESSAALGTSDTVDPKRVGRELGVRHVLAGTVRQDGERLSITARLLRSDTGALLWSDRFEYPSVADWAAQQNILARVGNVLDVKVRQSMLERAMLSRPSNAAVDHWMRGAYLMSSLETPEQLALARGHFEAALAAQPGSVQALTGLAHTHLAEVRRRWSKDRKESLAIAKALARRALAVNPDDQTALLRLSAAQNFAGEMEDAMTTTRRLLQLNPNNAAAHLELAVSFFFLGRWEDTLRQGEVAERLNPLDVANLRGLHDTASTALVALHRYDEAVEQARRGAAAQPSNLVPLLVLASAEAHRNNLEAARQYAAEILKRRPDYWVGKFDTTRGSTAPAYLAARRHFNEGLRLAGLPDRPPPASAAAAGRR